MKIVLLNPPIRGKKITRDMAGGLGFDAGRTTVLPPLDLAYLAATLRNRYDVDIVDSSVENLGFVELLEKISFSDPDIIIGNISLPSLRNDSLFMRKLKQKNPASKIITKTAINYPQILEEILKISDADLCIFDECELDICDIIEGNKNHGTAFLEGQKLIMTECAVIDNLDLLPLPARDILKNELYSYPLLGNKCTIMQTSRGCPFSCSYYCPYPLIQGKKWRAMSPERVYTEMEDIVMNYNINKVLFRDACFTFNKERTEKICDLIIQNNLQIKWWCETRINCIDKELLKIMKKAGCEGVNIGVETGDPEVMSGQAKQGVNLEKLIELRKNSSEIGIKLHFLLLVGFPEETRHSLYKTFKLIQEFEPDSIGVTTLTPYPGTPLYHEAVKNNWIETFDWEKYCGNLPTMHTENLSCNDLMKARRMIEIGSFLNKKKSFPFPLLLWVLEKYFKKWSHS